MWRVDTGGEVVAIKTTHGSAEEAGRERELLERAQSPRVVKTNPKYELGEFAGEFGSANVVAVMEMGETSLMEVANKRGGTMGEDEVEDIARDMMVALADLESRHIVHRDVNPNNVLLCEGGVWKLADFGCALLLPHPGCLVTAKPAGTIRYMAPEVVRESGLDTRSDVWSMGASLLHLVAGRPYASNPFEPSVLFDIGRGLSPLDAAPPEIVASLSERIVSLLSRCFLPLQHRPTASEILNHWSSSSTADP